MPLLPSLSVECGESLGEDWERGRWDREEEVPGNYKIYEWVNTKICKKKIAVGDGIMIIYIELEHPDSRVLQVHMF